MTLLELYKPHLSMQSVILRRAIRLAICLAIASILAILMHYSHSFWLPLTTAIIMQPTIGGTLRKGLQRSIGTLVGILLGGFFLWLAGGNLYIQSILLIIIIFVAYYSQVFNQINYGLYVIPLTMMVILLLASLIPQNIPDMLVERCTDTIAASILVIIFSYFVLPNTTKDEAALAIYQLRKTIADLIHAIVAQDITPIQYHQQVLTIIQTNQRIWPEWIYETYLNHSNRALYQQVVYSSEICFETLAALKWQMVHASPEKKQILTNLLAFIEHEFAESTPDSHSILQNPHFDLQLLPIDERFYFTRLQQAARKLKMLELRISEMRK